MIGSSIGPYRILERIGAGGMGEVYLASDPRLDRRVAIKRVAVPDDELRARIRREARAAARLTHPNVGRIYDVVDSEGDPCLVMEYLQGRSLADVLKSRRLEPREILSIGRQLASGLAAAHAEGLIHRDLKPANVILCDDGTIKLIDFGLARRVGGPIRGPEDSTVSPVESSVTTGHHVIGTPPYIAPEVLAGHPADQRSDLYSLGVTLFELATGRRPFQGSDFMALAVAVTSRPTPLAHEVDPGVPRELGDIIRRAMDRDPGQRFESVAELEKALERVSIGSRPRWLGRTMGVAALAVVAAVALLGAPRRGGPPGVTRAPAPGPSVLAVLPFLNLGPDSTRAFVAAGMTDVVATSLATLDLTVLPLSATIEYSSPDRDLVTITRNLGATLLLDASLQESAGRVRVALRLIRPPARQIEWSRTVDGELVEIFALQRRVVDELISGMQATGTLRSRPSTAALESLALPMTTNREAFADYSQARSYLERLDSPADLRRAMRLFESAARRDPAFAETWAGLGEARWALYRMSRSAALADSALDALETASDLAPGRIPVRFAMARILAGVGRRDSARTILTALLEAQPRHDEALGLLGQIEEEAGNLDRAAETLLRAIELRPAYWLHHHRLGLVYRSAGRSEDAIVQFRRVTELRPDSHWGFQALGTVWHELGRIDSALVYYRESHRIRPSASVLSNMGTAEFSRGQYAAALANYREATTMDPRNPTYARNFGDACRVLGMGAAADSSYRIAIDLCRAMRAKNPDSFEEMGLEAVCLAKLDRFEEADQLIDQAIVRKSSDSRLLYRKATILALAGKAVDGLGLLAEALDRGFPPDVARQDPDLAGMAQLPEFDRLLAAHEGKDGTR